MKFYSVIFFILLFSYSSASDSLNLSAIRINNFSWYEHVSSIVAANGQSLKKEFIEDEMGSNDMIKCSYLKDVFYINVEEQLCGFFLAEQTSFVVLSGAKFQIGTTLTKLKNWFPLSYREYLQHKIFRIRIKNTDSYLIFSIESSKVKSIESWEDN